MTLRGATVWILGFLAFVAGLNSINAILLLTQQGPEGMLTPYLIGNLTGDLSIATYLWISVLVTFVFLGMTLNSLVNKMPDPAILEDITKKVDDLQNDQNVLSKLKTRLMIIDANIGEIRSGFVEGFGEQREGLKKMHGEFVNKFDKKLFDFKQEMAATLGKLEKATHESEQSDKRNMVAIKRQVKEIANIKLKLQKLEEELAQPKPQLTSQSELRKVKGIGTRLAGEMKGIGIGNVGELILTDPLIISEKTGSSQKTVEKLQGRAQLLMVPGITTKDITLLEELGINTKRKLADQDAIELGMRMNGILKAYVENGKISEAEKPTIEELDSWIRFAKT